MESIEFTENCVALFARESATETVPGASMERQIQCLSAFCDEHGFRVVRTYREVGPALDGERPVFEQLLSDAANSRFKTLLCCSVDRLSRSAVGLGTLIQVSEANGVKIVPICTPDTSPLQTLTSMFVGYVDRRALARRATMGRRESAEKGRVPSGKTPYGYVRDSDGRIRADEDASRVVRRIFDLYANQAVGAKFIAALLNEDGIVSPGRSRSGWTRSTVLRILRRCVYTGTLTYSVGWAGVSKAGHPEPLFIRIQVPVLVDQCLWDRARDLRARQNRRPVSSR